MTEHQDVVFLLKWNLHIVLMVVCINRHVNGLSELGLGLGYIRKLCQVRIDSQ